jgi:hypothetical protein
MARLSIVLVVFAGLVSVTAAACSDGLGPVGSDGVEVQVFRNGVVVANTREDSIGRFVADQWALAAMLWVPCVDQPHCTWIQPGDAELLHDEDVAGWGSSNTLVVFWWHAVPNEEGGFEPDAVRRIEVEY